MQEEPEQSRDRLMGVIPSERIARTKFVRPSEAVIQGFRQLEDLTCSVGDVLDSLGLVGVISASVLKPISDGQRIAGPALTVRYVPDRVAPGYGQLAGKKAQLAGHFEAYSVAEPGDVLVVAAGGDPTISCLGGLSTRLAVRAGLAGTVVDGAVRDVASIRSTGYPIWACGVTPRTGKFRYEVIEIGGVVECAGIQVAPGDLVLADDDGVAVVPSERAEEVLRLALEASERDRRVSGAIEAGLSSEELRRILAPDKW